MSEKKSIKINFSAILICLLLLVVIAMSYILYELYNSKMESQKNVENTINELQKDNSTTKNNSESNSKITSEEKNSILGEISYIEIQVDDSDAHPEEGPTMSSPLKITDETIINNLKNIVNASENYTCLSAGGFYESAPIATIYQKDGKKLFITAIDAFTADGPTINMFDISNNPEFKNSKSYKTNNMLAEFLINAYNSKK